MLPRACGIVLFIESSEVLLRISRCIGRLKLILPSESNNMCVWQTIETQSMCIHISIHTVKLQYTFMCVHLAEFSHAKIRPLFHVGYLEASNRSGYIPAGREASHNLLGSVLSTRTHVLELTTLRTASNTLQWHKNNNNYKHTITHHTYFARFHYH